MQMTNKDLLDICMIAARAREGHLGSSLSVLDILSVIFRDKSKHDCFILSKGHASLGLYYILYKYKYINADILNSFCQLGSPLGGHPDFHKVPGVFGSTGSLGHGLPLGIGKALARRTTCRDGLVIVLVGDGELNEGSIWESFLLGSHHSLDNLVCIVDFNGSSERAVSVQNSHHAVGKLGWKVTEVDGHHHESLRQAIFNDLGKAPKLVWAHTIKGKGIALMEGNPEWHHRTPDPNDLIRISKELGLA